MMRKKWIEGVVELKYKTTINDMLKKAEEQLIPTKDNLGGHCGGIFEGYIQDGKQCVKVEFYKGLSDVFQRPTIKARFSLVEDEIMGKKEA